MADQALIGGRCAVCWSSPARVAYLGCGHIAVCQGCDEEDAPALARCPYCRSRSGRLRLFAAGLPSRRQVQAALEATGARFQVEAVAGSSSSEEEEAQPPPPPPQRAAGPHQAPTPPRDAPTPPREAARPLAPQHRAAPPFVARFQTFDDALEDWRALTAHETDLRFYAIWSTRVVPHLIGVHASVGRHGYDRILQEHGGFGRGMQWRSESSIEDAIEKYHLEMGNAARRHGYQQERRIVFFGWVHNRLEPIRSQ